jgi:hypothetical protein
MCCINASMGCRCTPNVVHPYEGVLRVFANGRVLAEFTCGHVRAMDRPPRLCTRCRHTTGVAA